ncbi:MAG: hypothetical protein M0Z60_12165 [Nitrospiraceae bacterium]|nr:hypothetical protein [Nitrospiraceae bacterium]
MKRRRPGFLHSKELAALKGAKSPIVNVSVVKELKTVGFKAVPSSPTPEQVAKINQFTRRAFSTEELYVGQLRLSNNCIDRDDERFSEPVLDRFVATTIRRTMLLDHSRSLRSAVGKFFDVQLEKMPLQQAIAEIGEDIVLPEGMDEVRFHCPWFYIARDAVDPQDLAKIEAGIYDFGSIGFRADSLVPVMNKDGDISFWEYRLAADGKGRNTEMTEGSLVYLGAQYGMAVKGAGAAEEEEPYSIEEDHIDKPKEGGSEMTEKEFLALCKKIFKSKSFSAETLEDDMGAAFQAALDGAKKAGADEAAKSLNEKITELEGKVSDLAPLAADGKAFRDGLVTDYVALKAKLGEVCEKPEDQAAVKQVAAGYPIDFLRSEVKHLQARVEAKFPDSQLSGDARRDKSGDLGGKGKSEGGLVSDDWDEE